MKKIYGTPELELLFFSVQDIAAASGLDDISTQDSDMFTEFDGNDF